MAMKKQRGGANYTNANYAVAPTSIYTELYAHVIKHALRARPINHKHFCNSVPDISFLPTPAIVLAKVHVLWKILYS